MDHLEISQQVYQAIIDTIGASPIESGGVLAMKGRTITEFYFDANAGVGNRFYRPSTCQITKQVNQWLREGQTFGGFVHSHPAPYIHLSAMDIVAAEKTAIANQLSAVYMAILCEKELYFYKVIPQKGKDHPAVQQCTVQII